jgi:hypothetical protein
MLNLKFESFKMMSKKFISLRKFMVLAKVGHIQSKDSIRNWRCAIQKMVITHIGQIIGPKKVYHNKPKPKSRGIL